MVGAHDRQPVQVVIGVVEFGLVQVLAGPHEGRDHVPGAGQSPRGAGALGCSHHET